MPGHRAPAFCLVREEGGRGFPPGRERPLSLGKGGRGEKNPKKKMSTEEGEANPMTMLELIEKKKKDQKKKK